MVQLTRFDVRLVTVARDGAEAPNGAAVFVGLCGREFAVNHGDLDFTRGHDFTYVFGDQSNVVNAQDNDPRSPMPLDTDDRLVFPTYIRYESPPAIPNPDIRGWNLEAVRIVLNPGPNQIVLPTGLPGVAQDLWLGGSGKILYLRPA
jgi:hypothetical protein